MPTITTKDGVNIFYKDWGTGQPIVFSHGWPLSADDWDNQMMFFLNRGYRVIAHDRRGHGRSSQPGTGHDMDHYADDLAALTAHGEDASESRRPAQRSIRWPSGGASRQPRAILSGSSYRPLLRLQPAGRETVPRCHSELVAPGHDGRY